MSLQRAITLARGAPPADAERSVLKLLERELPAGVPIASSVTVFAPGGALHEIDLLILGHHALYLVEVKAYQGRISADEEDWTIEREGQEPKRAKSPLSLAQQKAKWMAALLSQELGDARPMVEAVVVIPVPGADLALPPAVRSHVITPRELVHAIQFGDLPGEPMVASRVPVDEATAAAVRRILQGIRGRPEPGRGRLRDEAPLVVRDLALDLRGRSELPEVDAALWFVGSAFVRALEERGLLDTNRLAGKGSADAETAFYTLFPALGPGHYLRTILRGVADHPIGEAVLGEVLDRLGTETLSNDAARGVLDLFRQTGPSGKLRWRFSGEPWTDLYQEGSAVEREEHGMLATPGFVDSLLLDRTLEPALHDMGPDVARVMDPACGSGLLLLAAFERIFDRMRKASPDQDAASVGRRALDRIHGADISPVATLVTRIRLMLAYIDGAAIKSLAGAARPPLHVVTADSLLKTETGSPSREQDDILGRRYEVVVCEPPFITCKDAARTERYRSSYRSARGKFSLATPFIERCFDLAAEDGFVGVFSSNAFMKRQFGKPLVEGVLSAVDVTCVIDTSGAYIPGHVVPTMVLFGRNRPPRSATVRVVAARRGEPMEPHDPGRGEVWSSIVAHLDDAGYEDDYIAVGDLRRSALAKHPWSLGVGGGAQIGEVIELHSARRLQEVVAAIQIGASSGRDEIFVFPPDVPSRLGVERAVVRPCLSGVSIRDWAAVATTTAITPYEPDERGPLAAAPDACWWRFLWRYRAVLEARSSARPGRPRPWWAWALWPPRPPRGAPRLLHAAVGWMNDFVIDRGDAVLRIGALCIEMPLEASEDDCFALLGYLNSSTVCYWLKQISHQVARSGRGDHPENELFDFSIGDIPVPKSVLEPGPLRTGLVALARQLDRAARQRAECAPERVLAQWDGMSGDALIEALGDAQMRELASLRSMVCDQENLDWLLYEALGLVDGAPPRTSGSALPEQRPFAWLSDEPPARLDPRLVDPWKRRREIARAHPVIKLLEERRYKRSFRSPGERREMLVGENEEGGAASAGDVARDRDFQQRIATACEAWLLDRIEDVFRGLDVVRPLGAAQIASRIEATAGTHVVSWLFLGSAKDVDLAQMIPDLLEKNAVSYHAALRHTGPGQVKRAEWERTWESQRRQDAGEDVRLEVPSTYDRKDYLDAVTWLHRGKLDVPGERFIRYPGAAPDGVTAMYGWAGWDAEQRAAALAALYEERQTRDGWETDRLAPFLAGIQELVNESPEGEPVWSIVPAVMLKEGQWHDAGSAFDALARRRKPKNKRDRQ